MNGKWRYYYDVGKTMGKIIDARTGKESEQGKRMQGYTKLEDWLGKDERERLQRAAARTSLHLSSYEGMKKANDDEEAKYAKYNYKADRKAENKELKLFENNAKAFIEYKNDYMKTPLGKLDAAKNTIDKGRNKVAKLLTKLAKKIDGNSAYKQRKVYINSSKTASAKIRW